MCSPLVKYDVPVYGTDIIDMIKKPVRINCVVNEDTLTIEQIENMLKVYNQSMMVLQLQQYEKMILLENVNGVV